ncbi:hypothetical protein Nepgr_005632 [Nepenthes gracilis]|uniref:Uncharacterized protein n=1 Tax=Nepenthes gracilis TaxID=150966 RepID=A0AAD3XGM7_NEPGR|nr:hypothetical protein Nepgr_005632 [Nepenthes gracilis]
MAFCSYKGSGEFCQSECVVGGSSNLALKSLHGNVEANSVEESMRSVNEESKFRTMDQNRRLREVTTDLRKTYQKRGVVVPDNVHNSGDGKFNNIDDEERDIGDGDGDGSTSCCSSDLFELDNALEIGVGRYTEELPVYETTRPHTNRAIANGLIV